MTLSFTDFQGIASVFIKYVFMNMVLNEFILSRCSIFRQIMSLCVCVQLYCTVKGPTFCQYTVKGPTFCQYTVKMLHNLADHVTLCVCVCVQSYRAVKV